MNKAQMIEHVALFDKVNNGGRLSAAERDREHKLSSMAASAGIGIGMARNAIALTEAASKVQDGIERFTREQFEAALPTYRNGDQLWKHIGFVMGEQTYAIPVLGTNKRIVIRSTVNATNVAAPSGSDSIRLWIEYYYKDKWFSLSGHDSRWTTRVTGWQERMITKLRELWQLALDDSNGRQAPASVATPVEQAPSPILSDLPEDEPDPISLTYEREPNDEQRVAIEAPVDQAVRVLAPPGSGKTYVLAHRYAYLLANGARPEDILAVTFNKKMATELLERIAKVTPKVKGTAADRQVSTIHAACFRILKEAGLGKPNVATGYEIKRAIEDLTLEYWPLTDERPGWTEVYRWINIASGNCLAHTQDLSFYKDHLGSEDGRILHEIRLKFRLKMRDEGKWTYPDMLFVAETELKTNREFREKFQRRFKWILVDEGQDTSGQAMRILATLAEPQGQFFIVGDADQLLYRFAGATPEANLYHGFERRFPTGLTVKLTVNYRSTKAIVSAAQSLISNNYGTGNRYDAKYQKAMQPGPAAAQGETPTYTIYGDAADEAAALVNSLKAELGTRQPDEIFVGARTRAQLGYLEGGLVRAKIPFINATGGSFWTLKHVAELVGYLKLTFDPSNNDAFAKIYNVPSSYMTVPWRKASNYGEYCPHRYLGRAFLQACNGSFGQIQSAISYRSSFRPGAEDLVMFMEDLMNEMSADSHPQHMLHVIREECYNKYLLASEGVADLDTGDCNKFDDLDAVLDIASQFKTVEEFLAYVEEAEKAAEAAENKSWDDHVVISTVHRLKGLERNVVYGVGLNESPDGLAGLLPHTFSLIRPPQTGTLKGAGKGLIEDERCICYVLLTRAREEVHFSGTGKYREKRMVDSRFIQEMGVMNDLL